MNIPKKLRSMLYPPLTPKHILYRLPFLVNMVCVGYLNYWRFKADLVNWPVGDANGFMDFAAVFGFISWIIAGDRVCRTFRKKHDTAGLIYLVAVMCLTLYFWYLALYSPNVYFSIIPSS